MITKSISNPDLFMILDENTHEIYHGCDQKWYATAWQRMAGCGPTAASNLIFYLGHTRQIPGLGKIVNNKKICLSLMEEVWEYVTPTMKGVSTTKMFYEAVLAYGKLKGVEFQYTLLDLPKNKVSRPGLPELLNFLEEALNKDTPVAFLNLCNGAEKNLDGWHWVTIISLEYTENRDQAFLYILDDGQVKKIDLALWYNTTTKESGFVYFTTPALAESEKMANRLQPSKIK